MVGGADEGPAEGTEPEEVSSTSNSQLQSEIEALRSEVDSLRRELDKQASNVSYYLDAAKRIQELRAKRDRGEPLSIAQTGLVLVKAALFLFGALGVGVLLSPRLFAIASRLRGQDVLLAVALAVCFVLAYLASAIGLAAIVGAYAAGLILEDVHFKDFTARGERHLRDLVAPIASFLVPVFFVLMGLKVDLRAFAQPEVLGLAALLIVAAIAGKQACALGAVGGGLDRLSIGIGMIPRGEVGLIFANIGLGLSAGGKRVVSTATFSAIVIMVMVTTMMTPPALKWSLGRGRPRPPGH